MPDRINPTALPPETLAELLRKGGCRPIKDSDIQDMADAGLPANADGTVSLIECTAWLLKEVNRNGSEPDPT